MSIWLHKLGANVFGYSLPAPTEPSLFVTGQVADLVENHFGDILDHKNLLKALLDFRPEIVIHMAAQPLVRASYENPIETYETNIMGTLHLLQALRQIPSVRSTVIVTTDKCYENFERDAGYLEDEPLGGFDPYSSSKACAELVTSAMRRSFFVDSPCSIATARAGNVIGGGDWAKDRLIPDFVRSFSQKKKAFVRNPNAIRPWQHVMEPLSGYLLLAEKLFYEGKKFAEAWNLGPYEHDSRDVRSVADHLVQLWGDGARWDTDLNQKHPHEAHYLKLNTQKALRGLGWKPRLSLNECLDLTCQWYKDYYQNKSNAYDLTMAQLHHFEQRL